MNRYEHRSSALGKIFQRLFIANGDAARINLNQSVLLQSRQRPRNNFANRADAGGDLLIGKRERDFDSGCVAASARSGFREQPSRQPLIDFAQRQRLFQATRKLSAAQIKKIIE